MDKLDNIDNNTQAIQTVPEQYIAQHIDNNSENAPPLLSSSQVELQVKCEVGKLNLTLDELLKLKVGSIVELVRWPNSVKLSANGVYFAEGMLVEVDGMLAVKVTNRLNSIIHEGT